MSIDQFSETIPASGTKRLTAANFFFLVTASALVTVRVARDNTIENFSGAIAGLKIGRINRWQYIDIVGPAGTTLSYLLGYTSLREDVNDIQQAIATIAGTVPVIQQPSSILTDTPDAVLAFGAQTPIAQNLNRRRITIGCRTVTPDSIRVSSAGGAGRGIEIAPGSFVEFVTTAALIVRNDNAAGNATWYAEEES